MVSIRLVNEQESSGEKTKWEIEKEYNRKKKMEAFDSKLQEYINREQTSDAKRLALDNMVYNIDDILNYYFTANGIVPNTQDRMLGIINDFFESVSTYNESFFSSRLDVEKGRQSLRAITGNWSETDAQLTRASIHDHAKQRIILKEMDDIDIYYYNGIWAVLPKTDELDIDDENDEDYSTNVADYITNLSDLSEEIQEELTETMKSNFMFYFDDNKMEVVDGVFTEWRESRGYVPEEQNTVSQPQGSVSPVINDIINNAYGRGGQGQQQTNQPNQPNQPNQHVQQEHRTMGQPQRGLGEPQQGLGQPPQGQGINPQGHMNQGQGINPQGNQRGHMGGIVDENGSVNAEPNFE